MDSKKLEILVTAADLGSFTKAAEVAGYTQSGLTHMMDSLEREIGFPLLRRDHSGVSLTEQGEQLLPAIRDFLRAGAALDSKIQSIREKRQDTIRVAAYASMAMRWLPEILYRFRRACPETTVELRMVDHALEPFELLEQGRTDVIFAGRQPDLNCDWTPLYDEPMYAILPRDYPLQGRNSFPLEEFAGQEFLMPYGRFDNDVEAAFRKVKLKLRTTPARVDDETVIRMVGMGLGVTMMAELMIRGSTGDVLCVPVEPRTVRQLGMGLRSGEPVRESVALLKKCVLEFVSTYESRLPG